MVQLGEFTEVAGEQDPWAEGSALPHCGAGGYMLRAQSRGDI